MSTWDMYPTDYRSAEAGAVLSAAHAGECAAVIGLSGAGKSNLLGFLAHRCNQGSPHLLLIDGNRASPRTASGLLRLTCQAVTAAISPDHANIQLDELLPAIEAAVARRLETPGIDGLCLLFDRFDALPPEEQLAAAGPLRALRDAFKYSLTYVIATRRPLDPAGELAELFFANTLWLGPLSTTDARWSAQQVAARRGTAWDEETLSALVQVSWGYPSLLRACCEAAALGCPVEEAALRAHPAVRRRAQELWAAEPSAEDVARSRLAGQPLLADRQLSPADHSPISPDNADLTASEHRLLAYLQAHPAAVCAKDDLIGAVWPEDRLVAGLRDDSLAQLVRRLRQKVEPDPAHPQHILTVPGRGYRFIE